MYAIAVYVITGVFSSYLNTIFVGNFECVRYSRMYVISHIRYMGIILYNSFESLKILLSVDA